MDQSISIREGEIRLEAIDGIRCEQIRMWRNKDNVCKGFLYQKPITYEEQQRWYASYVQREDDQMFMIYWQDKPVGALALYHIDEHHHTAEFGRMMIGEDWARGKGIAKQAMKMLCEYGTTDLGLEKIYLEVFGDNESAYRLYEKVGFEEQYTYSKDNHVLRVMYYDKK